MLTPAEALYEKLPIHVKQITNQYPESEGPNCLNAVAYWHGHEKKLRHLKWRGFEKMLKNPQYFTKLKKSQKPKWGDIVVFRYGPRDLIIHASVFLNSVYYWQKPDNSRYEPWQIIPSSEVHKLYSEVRTVEYYRPLHSN